MARRAALLAVLLSLPTCSAISFARTASDAAAAEPQPASSECQEVKVGTPCYESVDWLRQYGLSKHPEWYPGYTSESTFEEVQDLLHGLGKVNCPKPCFVKKPLADNCRDVAEGSCYDSILWLKQYGLEHHPDWYPNLQPSSSVSEIQAELHRSGKVSCPKPCAFTEMENVDIAKMTGLEQTAKQAKPAAAQAAPGEPTEQCMDAKPNTPCYSAVIYGINEGISNYPFMYEGLKADGGLSFKKVQEYLYLQARPGQEPCERPCPSERVDLETLVKHPEDLRVKKRVEDMSMSELEDFFSGKWDGYVSKIVGGDWQPTTTFEKRLYDPTTTVPENELPDYKLPLPLVDGESTDMDTETGANASSSFPDRRATARMEAATTTEMVVDTGANASSSFPDRRATARMEAATTTEMVVDDGANASSSFPDRRATAGMEAATITEMVADTGANASSSFPDMRATAPVKAASTTELTEAARVVNDTALELANVSTWEVVQDGDIVDEPMPEVDGHGRDVEEPETREELEQRIRKQLMDEMQLQTTTVAVYRETEEEMRQRLKEEIMREMMHKGQ